MQSKIKNTFDNFHFDVPALLQYWTCRRTQNGLHLTMIDQPFRLPNNDEELRRYRGFCVEHSHGSVVPELEGENFFPGIAARTGFANQRTNYDPDQCIGHLVVPVYNCWDVMEVVGVIELVTVVPQESYAECFIRINELLKRENLATKTESAESF